jgi:hypothetical protein
VATGKAHSNLKRQQEICSFADEVLGPALSNIESYASGEQQLTNSFMFK